MTWWALAVLYPAGVLTVAVLALGVLALRRRYLVIHVTGQSMEPSLQAGDRVLVRRAGLAGLRTGMIIVLHAWPDTVGAGAWLIKRLAGVPGDLVPEAARTGCGNAREIPAGMAVVLSDSETGGDSRIWGFASASQVVGYVTSPLPRSRHRTTWMPRFM